MEMTEDVPPSPPASEAGSLSSINLAEALETLAEEDLVALLREVPDLAEEELQDMIKNGTYRSFFLQLYNDEASKAASEGDKEENQSEELLDSGSNVLFPSHIPKSDLEPSDDDSTRTTAVVPATASIKLNPKNEKEASDDTPKPTTAVETASANPNPITQSKMETNDKPEKPTVDETVIVSPKLLLESHDIGRNIQPRISPKYEPEDAPVKKRKKKKNHKQSRSTKFSATDLSETNCQKKAEVKKQKRNRLESAMNKYKHKLKAVSIIAVDMNKIALVKNHMVIKKEKLSKFEKIDTEKRREYCKLKGFTPAVLVSIKNKFIKLEKRHRSTKLDENSTTKKQEDMTKKKKQVLFDTNRNDSGNNKSKNKICSAKPDENFLKKNEDKNKRKWDLIRTDQSDKVNNKLKDKISFANQNKEKAIKAKDKCSTPRARTEPCEKKCPIQTEIRQLHKPEQKPTAPALIKEEEKNKLPLLLNVESESSKKVKELLMQAERDKANRKAQTRIEEQTRSEIPKPTPVAHPPSTHTASPLESPPASCSVRIKTDPKRFFRIDQNQNRESTFRSRFGFGSNFSGFRARPLHRYGMQQFRSSRFYGNNSHRLPYHKTPFNRSSFSPVDKSNDGPSSRSTVDRPLIKPEDQPPRKAARLEIYDDDNNDMLDLPSDEEEFQSKETPTPITEVALGEAAKITLQMLSSGQSLGFPEHQELSMLPGQEVSDYYKIINKTAYKAGWWFQTWDKDPVPWEVSLIPEYTDNKLVLYNGGGSDLSSIGNLSIPDNTDEFNEEVQSNGVSSSDQRAARERNAKNPDIQDEYCGASLLVAQYRTSTDDTFKNIFELRPGMSYERENLQTKCTICDERIVGKRHLGVHVRSDKHRDSMKKLSLNLLTDMAKPSYLKTQTNYNEDNANRGRASSHSTTTRDRRVEEAGTGDLQALSGFMALSYLKKSRSKSPATRRRHPTPRRRVSKSRSRSRSPQCSSRRERSPARKATHYSPERTPSSRTAETSSGHAPEFLENTQNPPGRPESPHNRGTTNRIGTANLVAKKIAIFAEKLRLLAAGLWTPVMEGRWKSMEAEEAALVASHQKYQDKMRGAGASQSHPSYHNEWKEFWEIKYLEVANAGLDADNYDYGPDWQSHWEKRVEVLMAEEFDIKVNDVQLKYGMDLRTLQRLTVTYAGFPGPGTTWRQD